MLEARDISFGYEPASLLYEGFSFAAERGERVALKAPSGFGKTTLCRLLCGYERPFAGGVFVDGEPLPTKGVRPVQLICQHPEKVVDPRLRMGRTLAEAPASAADVGEALGIRKEWLSRYPHELSGGELQRFCIARALAAQPSFIVADEITTMLDAVTQAEVWAFLVAWAERNDAGLVFVSHSPSLVRKVATRVVELG